MSACLCGVVQPGGYSSSPWSGSILSPDHQFRCNAGFPYWMALEIQPPLKESIEADGFCAGLVRHILIGDMFRS